VPGPQGGIRVKHLRTMEARSTLASGARTPTTRQATGRMRCPTAVPETAVISREQAASMNIEAGNPVAVGW